jgi:hypothetical protein
MPDDCRRFLPGRLRVSGDASLEYILERMARAASTPGQGRRGTPNPFEGEAMRGLRAGASSGPSAHGLAHAWADMTPAQAFDAGKAFGQSPQGAAAVKGAISGANAADQVPHHDTAHAHSSYYGGGDGDPRTPGGARVSECASVTYADAKQQAECDAINDLANNRSARPPLAIVPADPILVKGAAVKADPAAVAGAFGGAYGECKTTTVTQTRHLRGRDLQRVQDPGRGGLPEDAHGNGDRVIQLCNRHRRGDLYPGYRVLRQGKRSGLVVWPRGSEGEV